MIHDRRLSLAAIGTLALSLSACVFESPYWAQTFATTTTPVPIQTWTVDPTRTVRIECSKAYHGGLYPFEGPETWLPVTDITPSSQPSYDPAGSAIYSAGARIVLPAACWHADGAYTPALYTTALRATQTTSTGSTTVYRVFDAAGLECLGREDGRGKNWFAWMSRNCALNYSGSTTPLPWVKVLASAQGAAMAMAPAGGAGAAGAMAGAAGGAAGAAAATTLFPTTESLVLALSSQAVDKAWAADTAARLQTVVAKQAPEGSQWLEADCRSTLCRIDIWHRDADAQRRFVAALSPLGLFSHDGVSGWWSSSQDRSGIRSRFFIAREGTKLPLPAKAG